MRGFGILMAMVVLGSIPAPADAGLAARCRKGCRPAVAECISSTGQSRRVCKRTMLQLCKRQGLGVCSLATTTTTPSDDSTTTTTTLPGGGGGGGGVMSVQAGEVSASGDEDPRLYTVPVRIKYSVVTADAETQVSLDPSHFSVLDEDSGVVYPAEPPAAAGDCAATHIVTIDGPAIECTLHFLMPLSVGGPSAQDGGEHAKLKFAWVGLHGSDGFSL